MQPPHSAVALAHWPSDPFGSGIRPARLAAATLTSASLATPGNAASPLCLPPPRRRHRRHPPQTAARPSVSTSVAESLCRRTRIRRHVTHARVKPELGNPSPAPPPTPAPPQAHRRCRILFKSVALAIEDLVAAGLVWRNCKWCWRGSSRQTEKSVALKACNSPQSITVSYTS